jgi:uncharacterized membrane protein
MVPCGAPGFAGFRQGSERDMADTARPADVLGDFVHRIEGNEGLDRPAAVLERVAEAVAPPGPVHDALTGTWLGHAVHPAATDLPIGFWTSASVLDLIGGKAGRHSADRLLFLGIVSAVPTAATGLAEWLHTDPRNRRVGVVHANANLVGLACYSASWVARKRGRRGRGVLYALAGMTAATVGGLLGGHLAIGRKVGTTSEPTAPGAAPAEPGLFDDAAPPVVSPAPSTPVR